MQSSNTCTIPPIAQAYSFNITVVPAGPLSFITAYPTGQPLPLAATVTSPQGFTVSNAAIVPAGSDGSLDLYASDSTDIIIDINGYYAQQNMLPLTGTADAPGLTFGDASTGLFSSSSGTVSISTNGQTRLSVLQNGDLALNGNLQLGGSIFNPLGGVFLHHGGYHNTALGNGALVGRVGKPASDQTAALNIAIGDSALNNTTGGDNLAIGFFALSNNYTGIGNIMVGNFAGGNQNGSYNIGLGEGASGGTGGFNIAIGHSAGSNLTTGDLNILMGNTGQGSDTKTIRIGDPQKQTRAFISGVRGTTTSLGDFVPVVIDSKGQLGTVSSSRRFKEEIQDMGDSSSDLLRLRPVTFRYKKPFVDGSNPIQYGLIAEEVAEVYPDLIAKSADGKIETVKYQVLDSMLLNELQKEHQQVQQLTETIRLLETRLAVLEELLSSKIPALAAANK